MFKVTLPPYWARTGLHAPLWVIGSIDSYDAIHARHCCRGENNLHSGDQARGHRWRWHIQKQKFVTTSLPGDQMPIVVDWLERNGYKGPGTVAIADDTGPT